MAVTKDDTTQGAVHPPSGQHTPTPPGSFGPGGVGQARQIENAPSQGGGGPAGNGPPRQAIPIPGTGGNPNPVISPMGHIETLVKTEPGLSPYALRSALTIAALSQLAHGDDPLKNTFQDFVTTLRQSMQQPAELMDAMEAALAHQLGGQSEWINNELNRIRAGVTDYAALRAGYVTQDEQGPALPTQVAKAELDQRTTPPQEADHMAQGAGHGPTPQYEDWSPAALLHQWLMGPSAAQAAGVVEPIRAEAQGQGVPGAPIGAPGTQAPGP